MLDPTAPHLAEQLACLRQIRAELGPNTPMLQTIFNPLAQAKNLAGQNTLLVHLRKYPDAVMKGLQTIAVATQRFIEAALDTGIDGIFYAVQHAQATLLNEDEFNQFSQSLDLQILDLAQGLWCNMLHIHGEDIYFDQVSKYPVQIVNWHDREDFAFISGSAENFQRRGLRGLEPRKRLFIKQCKMFAKKKKTRFNKPAEGD